MTRMERFEKIWAHQHAVPPESLLPYRWVTQEGYRLPAMAAHFRTFCETLDSLVIELHKEFKDDTGKPFGELLTLIANAILEDCRKAIEDAGLKVAS